ncbi:MAG: DUF1580 domain-containing protein [Phycisphaerae bacterium]|nr:DUF1580 domain-containing protein [Phycisphaerae bacterium]
MIDIGAETLIPIREVPRHLPPRPNGKRVHMSACYRWIKRGVRGVRLDSIKIGGSTYTSTEALQRFADHLSSGWGEEPKAVPAQTLTRQRQIDKASNRLAEMLRGTNRKPEV